MTTTKRGYAAKVARLEAEGLTTSDAQAAVDAEARPPRPRPTTNGQRRARREAAKAAAKKPAAKPPTPRAAKAHADPARVRAYFETTGLSRKEIAAVLGKSTGLIAHVTRDTGDRWSIERFRAAVDAIERHVKAKRVERPIAEPMTTATLSMFFVPEGDVVEGEPKARKPRTRRKRS
ncbi:MAG: hypothetical protein ABI841_05745 [Chloroflexota bacterium]